MQVFSCPQLYIMPVHPFSSIYMHFRITLKHYVLYHIFLLLWRCIVCTTLLCYSYALLLHFHFPLYIFYTCQHCTFLL